MIKRDNVCKRFSLCLENCKYLQRGEKERKRDGEGEKTVKQISTIFHSKVSIPYSKPEWYYRGKGSSQLLGAGKKEMQCL